MTIVPFQPDHLQQIDLQAEQSVTRDYLNNGEYAQSLAAQEGWTVIHDGAVIACAGFIKVWGNRHQAWAVISATIGPAGMLLLTKAALRGLQIRTGRIECYVATGFEAGHRWARMLGFTLETPEPMRQWLPDGSDASQYSRIL